MNFDMNNQNNNGSLLRFRSAPSSVFQSFMNEIEKSRDLNVISQSFQDLEGEVDDKPTLLNGYSSNSQLPPHYPRQGTTPASMDGTSSYIRGLSSQQTKMGSSLLRQNSSPAGLFTHLNHQKGYNSAIRGQMSNFSPGLTSFGTLSRISEVEPETVEPSILNDASGYPFGSWENEQLHFTENFTGLKRELDDDDDDGNIFGGSQNVDNSGNHPTILSHHLSLPKTSSGEMADMENFLHFQDSVPCKIRAKRGCATHPRSIAERVRRTRISQRMRKLQELVPNMDNQTNTSDMLDLAVDYIKDLQKQYKTLSDCRANCRCSAMSSRN